MNTSIPTRRSLLGGTAAAIAMLAAGQRASAEPRLQRSGRLQRAMMLHDRLEAECARFDVEVEEPARKACCAAIAAYSDEPPPPHEECPTTFVNAFGETVRLSTDRVGAGAVARKVVHDSTWAEMGDESWRQAHRELAAAHNRRDAVLAAQMARRRAFEAETRRSFGIEQLAARSEALAERRYRLWRASLTIPAASMGDVVAKLDFIGRTIPPDDVGQHELSAIAADVRRLAGEA